MDKLGSHFISYGEKFVFDLLVAIMCKCSLLYQLFMFLFIFENFTWSAYYVKKCRNLLSLGKNLITVTNDCRLSIIEEYF